MVKNDVVVLLSTYNGGKYLRQQIDSILNQSIGVDVFIRDDGSEDDTVKILEEYVASHDNIKLIKGENIGFVKSLFYLIRNVENYDYISFADQDDIWLKNKLEIAITKLRKHEDIPAFYASCSKLVDDNLKVYGLTQKKIKDITIYNTLIQNISPGHSQVINNKLFDIIKSDYDLNNIFCPDIWIAQVASLTAFVYFDNNPYTLYRQHSNNTLDYGKKHWQWIIQRMKRLRNDEVKKVCIQTRYLLSIYSDCIKQEQKEDIEKFINCQSSIIERFKYILKDNKFYRQKKSENIYFYILFILGCYKTINDRSKL